MKGAADIIIEGNTIYGNIGDNNGILDGYDRGTWPTILHGSGSESKDVIIRKNILYDNCGGILPGKGYKIYNNIIVENNRDYTGPNSSYQSTGQPFFAGINGWNIFNKVAIKNNIVGGHNSADIYVKIGAESLDINGNLYFNDGGAKLVEFRDRYDWNRLNFSSWKSYLSGESGITGNDSNSLEGDPLFVNPSEHDYHLQPISPCVDAGSFLTRTISSGSGTQIAVEDAGYFCDGFGIIEGDFIQVGSNSPVRITNVDYDSNMITVEQSISWNDRDPVNLPYSGSAPDIGAYEYVTEITKGTLLGTVSSAGNPIPNATVTAGEYETLTNESGSYHMKLPPGTYTVTASAEGYEPASGNVTIAPGNNKILNFSLSPPSLPHTVYGFVFLHNGTTPAVGVDVTLAHEQGNLSTSTASDGSYTFDLGNLPSYNDNDRLQITASSGKSFASANITVNTSVEPQKAPDLVLNIPPSISLTSPVSGTLTNSSSVTLQWTSSDDDGDALSHTVILDGSSYDAGSSSSYTLALADGTHTWKVAVSDSFVSIESATRTFTIDTTPPVVTIDPVTSPTNSTTQTISGSFIETGSGIARITVNGIPAEISGTTFYANISLSEGENIITVIATDKAGNSDSQSTSIILLKSASISLAKAWNLLSLPLNLSIDAETFGKKANATCIVAWNNTAKSYTSHVVGTASNLFDMKTGHGYWVSYPDTCGNVQIDGILISNVTYDLKRGWNLIGSMNGTAEEICSALGSSSITIWDEASQKYISHVAGLMSNNFNIARSEGCWVWVDSDTTIVV